MANSRNNRVQKFTKDGYFLSGWGSVRDGTGEFDRPAGTGIDDEDRVYITDSRSGRVEIYTKDMD